MRRWVSVRVSEQAALEYTQILLRAMALLLRYGQRTSGQDRLAAEIVYLGLGELVDILERGLEEDLPTDQWGRPILPPEVPLREWLDRGQGMPVFGTSLDID
jgi:hypothetical protein